MISLKCLFSNFKNFQFVQTVAVFLIRNSGFNISLCSSNINRSKPAKNFVDTGLREGTLWSFVQRNIFRICCVGLRNVLILLRVNERPIGSLISFGYISNSPERKFFYGIISVEEVFHSLKTKRSEVKRASINHGSVARQIFLNWYKQCSSELNRIFFYITSSSRRASGLFSFNFYFSILSNSCKR